MNTLPLSRFESHLIENREVRFFLSSTFADMDEERTALVQIFQELRMEANRRNVTLSVIDLRWGVTEEESRSGKVLSVCLNEIEHSHPFFIGLLGSRYGSTPKATELLKNPDLAERYPWIGKDILFRDAQGDNLPPCSQDFFDYWHEGLHIEDFSWLTFKKEWL